MEFKKIAQAVGVSEYPEVLDQIYARLPEDNTPVCDLALIEKLQEEFDIFGKYFNLVKETAHKINADENFSTWVKVGLIFTTDPSLGEAKDLPVPELDGDPRKDLLNLYVLIPQMPSAIEKYRSCGFTYEQIADNMHAFRRGIGVVEKRIGRPALNRQYYRWVQIFARAEIFKVYGLQFQFRKMSNRAVLLRDKESGVLVPVMALGEFDASGRHRIGSMGFEEAGEGTFTAEFSEDDENYYGHGAVDCVVSSQVQTYPKSRWECIARPGDKCIGMHFPRGADISQENFDKAIAAARKLVRERYPEYAGCLIDCTSWLLDPALEDILGPNSKIVQLGKRYVRFPVKSGGKHVFGFVFPADVENYEDLPENTSLERGLKQLYLNGGCNYGYCGIVIE